MATPSAHHLRTCDGMGRDGEERRKMGEKRLNEDALRFGNRMSSEF